MKPSRRRFLETGALAGAALGLGRTALGEPRVAAAQAPPAPSWIDKPMRWAQLTLVEDDPGKFDLGFWLDYFTRTQLRRRLPERGRLRRLLPDARSRSITAAPGSASGTSSASSSRAAASSAWSSIARTDPHATYDDVAGRASRLDRGRRRRQAAPPLGLAGDVGHVRARPLQLRVHDRGHEGDRRRATSVDGIFINRWDGSGMCYCEHCRDELPRRHRPRAAAHATTRRTSTGAPRLHPLAPAAALRPLAALGRRGAQDQSRLLRDPQHRRRRHQLARHEDASASARAMMVADRQARRGLQPPWAIGMNAKEYRATMGRKPIVGHLQRGRRGALPLEGLGAEPGRDPAVGGRRRRQRHAAVVHEVRRRRCTTSAG